MKRTNGMIGENDPPKSKPSGIPKSNKNHKEGDNMEQELKFTSYDMKLMKGDKVVMEADNLHFTSFDKVSNNVEFKKALNITKPSGSSITITPEDIQKIKYDKQGIIREVDCGSFVLTLNSDDTLIQAVIDLIK